MRKSDQKVGHTASDIREIVFGFEDGVVSTLGAITGIAAGTGSSFVVILSGIVIVIVEAVSMGAGSYLSGKSAREVLETKVKQNPRLEKEFEFFFPKSQLHGALLMWLSYMVGGVVPLLPYFFLPIRMSYLPSIILALLVLLSLGAWKTRFTGRSWSKSALEMAAVSLGAALVGFVVGRVVSIMFGIEVV